MDVVVAAIITAILGPLVVKAVEKLRRDSLLPQAPRDRLLHLKGCWYGKVHQPTPDGGKEVYQMEAEIWHSGRVIKGSGHFESDGRKTRLVLYNGMFDGNVLKIEYRNELARIYQKGTLVVELDAYGTKFNGQFVGYSPSMEKIITGHVSCSKLGNGEG